MPFESFVLLYLLQMAAINYMGGKRNAAKARSKDRIGRLQRSFFGRQRLDVANASATTRPGVNDISLGYAKRRSEEAVDKTEEGDRYSTAPKRRKIDHCTAPQRSKLLEALDTSEPVLLRSLLDRILALPDLAGIKEATTRNHNERRKKAWGSSLDHSDSAISSPNSKNERIDSDSETFPASSRRWQTPPTFSSSPCFINQLHSRTNPISMHNPDPDLHIPYPPLSTSSPRNSSSMQGYSSFEAGLAGHRQSPYLHCGVEIDGERGYDFFSDEQDSIFSFGFDYINSSPGEGVSAHPSKGGLPQRGTIGSVLDRDELDDEIENETDNEETLCNNGSSAFHNSSSSFKPPAHFGKDEEKPFDGIFETDDPWGAIGDILGFNGNERRHKDGPMEEDVLHGENEDDMETLVHYNSSANFRSSNHLHNSSITNPVINTNANFSPNNQRQPDELLTSFSFHRSSSQSRIGEGKEVSYGNESGMEVMFPLGEEDRFDELEHEETQDLEMQYTDEYTYPLILKSLDSNQSMSKLEPWECPSPWSLLEQDVSNAELFQLAGKDEDDNVNAEYIEVEGETAEVSSLPLHENDTSMNNTLMVSLDLGVAKYGNEDLSDCKFLAEPWEETVTTSSTGKAESSNSSAVSLPIITSAGLLAESLDLPGVNCPMVEDASPSLSPSPQSQKQNQPEVTESFRVSRQELEQDAVSVKIELQEVDGVFQGPCLFSDDDDERDE